MSVFAWGLIAFAANPKLVPQNCNSCNQISIFYCQGETAPADMNEVVEMNSAFIPGNSLVWYEDNSGSKGALFNGTGEQPVLPSMASPSTSFYWVAQFDGTAGPARKVKVRVRKSPNISATFPSGTFCSGASFDLASGLSDSRKVADNYLFSRNGNCLGNVEATKGNPVSYFIDAPSPGSNNYQIIGINEGFQSCSDTLEEVFSTAPFVSLDSIPNDTVTAGDAVSIAFSSPDPETSFIIWADHASFNNPEIGIGPEIGLGNLSFIASNSSGSDLTAKIRVIPYAGNCAGKLQDFFITVQPSAPRLAGPQADQVLLYPNPAGSQLYFEAPFEVEAFEVINMKGAVVAVGSNRGANKVDLSSLPSGVFVLRLKGLDFIYTTKHFIKL
jgi:hypothetical protein